MGCVFDRYGSKPEKGSYIWIKYKAPNGKWTPKPVGRVKPDGITKAEYKQRVKNLEKKARDILAKIEGDVVGGQFGLRDESGEHNPLFAAVAIPWVEGRTNRSAKKDRGRMKNHLVPYFGTKQLSEITPSEVCRFIEHTTKKVQDKYGNPAGMGRQDLWPGRGLPCDVDPTFQTRG